jgi:hypothetical protein
MNFRIKMWTGWVLAILMLAGITALLDVHYKMIGENKQVIRHLGEKLNECVAGSRKISSTDNPSEDVIAEVPDDGEKLGLPANQAELNTTEAIDGSAPGTTTRESNLSVVLGNKDLRSVVNKIGIKQDDLALSIIRVSKANAELIKAQGHIHTIDAEIQVAIAEGVEKSRDKGTYVVYSKGAKYETIEGVLTAGESTPDGGMRIYY